MILSWPLVGRDEELGRLGGAMDAGAAGVVLVGPPGVGKTRLASESVTLAAARGWAHAVVRANRSAATIPFGAFAPLLPALEGASEGQVDALRLAAEAVAALAGTAMVLLVVDDAQELDESSAALVLLLAAHPAVFVVATLRTDDRPVSEALTTLWKDDLLERIDVGGLSADAAEQLVAEVLGGPVDGVTAQMLWSTSGGNALFLRELVLGALDAGTLQEGSGMWRLVGALSPSTRMGEVVGLRLGSVDDDARVAMEVVSIGEPVGITDLEALVSPGAIDALERRGLIEIVFEGAREQVRMAHPLYGEVVRAGIPVRRRQEICRTLADRIEARGTRRREDTLRVALWRLDGGGPGRADVLLDGALQARFAYDIALAERLARAAWVEAPDAASGHLLGETLDQLGRHDEAEEVLHACEPLATTERERALIALARSSNLFRGLGRAAAADAVMADAETTVSDPELRDEFSAQRAIHALFEGRIDDALAIVDPLLERGRDEDRAFVHGALPGAVARGLAGRTEEAIAIADHAFDARIALGDQVQIAGPGIYLVARAFALLEAGRLEEAEGTARLGYDGATERQIRDGQSWFSVILGSVSLRQGRARTAARWYREAALVYDDFDHPGARWGYGGLAHALALLGDLEGADAALADLDAEPPTPLRMMDSEIERGRAWVLAQRGEYSLAVETLRRAARFAAECGSRVLEASALHDIVRLGEDELSLSRLRELAGEVDGAFMPARLAHAEALANHDAERFEVAAEAFEAMGAMLYAAEAAAGAARAFTRDGLARRASEASQRTMRLADACEGARTPALLVGFETTPLTRREREVAELAARGLASKEIAEKLFVSTRTVENHLQRAYEKLGVRGRPELAAVLGIAADDPQ
jgi:DNA-binding CsgD family transcriptional regulator